MPGERRSGSAVKPERTGGPAVALIVPELALYHELVAVLSRHYDLFITRGWEELTASPRRHSLLALADSTTLAAWAQSGTRTLRTAGMRLMALVREGELGGSVPSLLRSVDDFIVLPFSEGELLVRVARLLKACPTQCDECRAGPFRVDIRTGEAYVGEERLVLTRKEAALLFALARQAGRTVPRDDLLDEVWGADTDASSNVLDACIRSLRRKVEPEPGRPRYIVTIRGIGYRLQAGSATDGPSHGGSA